MVPLASSGERGSQPSDWVLPNSRGGKLLSSQVRIATRTARPTWSRTLAWWRPPLMESEDRKQLYGEAGLEHGPMALAPTVTEDRNETVKFNNNTTIELALARSGERGSQQ